MKFRKVMALALAASMAVSLNAVSVLAEAEIPQTLHCGLIQ